MKWIVLRIFIVSPFFLFACTTDSKLSNDWLANAPEYSQNSSTSSDDSELSNVGHAHSHSNSGHR